MSIPNYLTFIRIFISPIFMLVYLEHEMLGITMGVLPYVLLLLFGISEISDTFDGFFARKYNQVTDFGKILDPMADSIYRISVFLTFTSPPVELPLLLVFIFIYRDSMISTLRTICALKGFALAARSSGKIKAVIQALSAFIILILHIPYSTGVMSQSTLHKIALLTAGVAAGYALFSGIEYIYANREEIKRLLTARTKGSVKDV